MPKTYGPEDFGAAYIDTLTFRGQSKLNEQTIRYSFDTSVNPHGNLTYKTDFDLGQTVKVISKAWGGIHDYAYH